MARRSKQKDKLRSGAARKSSASNIGSKSVVAGTHAGIVENPNKTGTRITQTQPDSLGGRGAASDTSSIGDAEESDSDGAEGDQDDEDEADANVMASSDIAISSDGDQTGHSNGHKAGAIENRPRSSGNVGGSKQRVRGRESSKATTQRMSGNEESDDEDDYSGVDLISDSDEQEPIVEQLEEKVIIESEEEDDNKFRTSPTLPSTSSDDWNGFDLEGDLFLSDVPYFDAQIGRTDPSILAEEVEIYNSMRFPHDDFPQGDFDDELDLEPPFPPPRRVRFAEDELAAKAAVLAAETAVAIARASAMEYNALAGLGFADVDERPPLAKDDAEDEDANSSGGRSSGYETDLGETTEEEDVPASATTRPHLLLRRTSTSPLQGPDYTTPTSQKRLPPTRGGYRWGPTMGSWIADPKKPIVMADSSGRKLVMLRLQHPRRPNHTVTSLDSSASSADSSPRPSVPRLANTTNNCEIKQSASSSQDPISPMVGSSPNLTMSSSFDNGSGTQHLADKEILGPPEAFFPFTNFDAGGNVIMDEDDDEDEDDLLNLDDFIDFGDTDDSDNDAAIKAPHSPSASSVTSAVSGGKSSTNLMDHLDKGVITAFRRNQYSHETAQSWPSVVSAQHTNPAFKEGKYAATDPPLSPLKKRRLSDAFDVENSPPHEVAVKRRSIIDTL